MKISYYMHAIMSIDYAHVVMIFTFLVIIASILSTTLGYIGYDIETYHPDITNSIHPETITKINSIGISFCYALLFSLNMLILQVYSRWVVLQSIKENNIDVIK